MGDDDGVWVQDEDWGDMNLILSPPWRATGPSKMLFLFPQEPLVSVSLWCWYMCCPVHPHPSNTPPHTLHFPSASLSSMVLCWMRLSKASVILRWIRVILSLCEFLKIHSTLSQHFYCKDTWHYAISISPNFNIKLCFLESPIHTPPNITQCPWCWTKLYPFKMKWCGRDVVCNYKENIVQIRKNNSFW